MKIIYVVMMMLAALVFTISPASAVPDPETCANYPEPRSFLEVQDWWTPLTAHDTENFGHVHLGMCFPDNKLADGSYNKVQGTVGFDFKVQLHDNPGLLNNVRIHLLDGNGQNHQAVSVPVNETAAQHCPATPNNCVWWVHVDLNTNVSTTDGFDNFRAAAIVTHPGDGGTKQFADTKWGLYVNNGDPLKHYDAMRNADGSAKPRTAGGSWYEGSAYEMAEFRSWIQTGQTVSGNWTVNLLMNKGAGGTDVTHTFISIDPSFHASPPYPGIVLRDANAVYSGNFTIDTTKLSNGPHKLFLRSDSTCDGTAGNNCGLKPEGGSNNVATHSSVQVIPFTVAN